MGGETTFKAVRYMYDRSGSCNWSSGMGRSRVLELRALPSFEESFCFFCLWVEMR
jgi:hypothetical protein